MPIQITSYEAIIDTGDIEPSIVRSQHYGINETLIMQQTIDALLNNIFMMPDNTNPYNDNIFLASKPHLGGYNTHR